MVGSASLSSTIRCWDDGANYASRSYNGTHCILGKWHGILDTFLNNNVTWTTPGVPERLFLSNIPVSINYPCFRGNTVITSVDFGCEIPWVGNKMGSTIKRMEKYLYKWSFLRVVLL